MSKKYLCYTNVWKVLELLNIVVSNGRFGSQKGWEPLSYFISSKHINTAVPVLVRGPQVFPYICVCICVFYFISSVSIDFSFSISAVPSLGLVLLAHDIQKHLWICGHLRPTTWWWAVTALIIPSVMRAVVILLMEVRHSIMGINQTQWVLRSLSSGILDERAAGAFLQDLELLNIALLWFPVATCTMSSPAFWRGPFVWL